MTSLWKDGVPQVTNSAGGGFHSNEEIRRGQEEAVRLERARIGKWAHANLEFCEANMLGAGRSALEVTRFDGAAQALRALIKYLQETQ